MASSSNTVHQEGESDEDQDTNELLKTWNEHPLVLTEIEDEIVQRDLRRCLIGEVIADENQSAYGLLQILNRAWRFTQALKVEEIGNNRYIFTFRAEEEAKEALIAGYWNVRGNPLVLRPWTKELEHVEKLFQKFPMWIQVHGIPAKYISDDNILNIVKRLGEVCEVDERDLGEFGNKRFRRVRVMIDQDNPIIPGFDYTAVKPVLQIRFRYEKCCNFCIHCGKIGHIVDCCTRRRKKKIIFDYTEDIRAESSGNQYLCFDRTAAVTSKNPKIVAGIRRGMQFDYPPVLKSDCLPLMEIDRNLALQQGDRDRRDEVIKVGYGPENGGKAGPVESMGSFGNRSSQMKRDYHQAIGGQFASENQEKDSVMAEVAGALYPPHIP